MAEGGRIGGVVNQQEGVSSAQAEVWRVEPLLLGGGREDRDGGEIHHPTLQSNYQTSTWPQLHTNSVAKSSELFLTTLILYSLYLDY